MRNSKHGILAWILCLILIISSAIPVFADSGAANASGGSTGSATGNKISGMTQLGGFNMYKVSVYMSLTNKGGTDPKKYSMGDFARIGSYYTTNGGAGGAANCRVFPASDKYRQFVSPTAPTFVNQPTLSSFSSRFPSSIPVWRYPGGDGQVNQAIIPYLKGVAAGGSPSSKEAYNRLQFYGVYLRFATEPDLSAIEIYERLVNTYRSQFSIYDTEGNKIDNNAITMYEVSPTASKLNEETGQYEKTGVIPWLLIVEPVYGMNVQGVAFAATASEAITMNIATQIGGYTIPKQNTANGFISGFISYLRQSLPASVHLESDGWFQYSKFKKPSRDNMFYSWRNNTNQEVFDYGGYALLFSFPAEIKMGNTEVQVIDKVTKDPIPSASVVDYISGSAKKSSVDSNGTATYNITKAGTYEFNAMADGYESPQDNKTLEVKDTKGKYKLVIELVPIIGNTSNKLEENELMKGFLFETPLPNGSTFTHSQSLSHCDGRVSDGNGGTKSCGHAKTLKNATSIKITKVNVKPANYWSSALFTENTLMGKLKTLRIGGTLKNDGVTAIFNQTGDFSTTNVASVFQKELTTLNLMAARGGIAGSDAEVPQLAAYMNGTKLNQEYNAFITPYVGTYPAKYNNPTSKMIAGVITTPLVIPGGATTATASVTYCSGGSGKQTVNGTLSTVSVSKQITVDKSYEATAKTSPVIPASKTYGGVNGLHNSNGTMIHINVPSKPITFYPAFKMKYSTTNKNIAPTRDVWMLAKGARVFNSNDYTNIELTRTDVQLSNPWSRDREDRFDKNGNALTEPVAKSGSSLKASSSDNTITIRSYIHVQDPAFAEDKAGAQAYINNIIAQYDAAAASINSAVPGNTSFYSNLWQSVTDATVHRVAAPAKIGNAAVANLTAKTKLIPKTITSNLNTSTSVYYVDNDETPDYDATRAVNIRGTSFPISEQWNGAGVNNSVSILSNLLETDKQVVKPVGWYDESYEGILVIARTYTISVPSVSSDYVQIHPQLSDFKTTTNFFAKTIYFNPNPSLGPVIKGADNFSAEDSSFGVGVEYRLPNITLAGNTFDRLMLLSAPETFNIRGSIYDTK